MKYNKNSMVSATALSFILATVPAYAEPGFMLGLSLNFGGGSSKLGATAKVLSSNIAEEVVGAAGVTYFIEDQSFGFDAGLGYTFDGGAVTFTYDFTHKQPQISIGVSNTKEKINSVC